MKISKKLINAYKLDGRKAYDLAKLSGLHPATFSQIMNAIIPVHMNDDRVLRIAKILGVKAKDAFEKDLGVKNENEKL